VNPKHNAYLAITTAALLLLGTRASGQSAVKSSDSYDELFLSYMQKAKALASAGHDAPVDWMDDLTTDRRARRVNDLVTIQVVENITGSGTADSALGKSSSMGLGVPSLVGLEKKLPTSIDPSALVGAKSDNVFKGSGTTTRTGALTAVLTARVADVLQNGNLVIEGVREIEINGERQIVVLTGVVRPSDINPGNVVASTSIGQLGIRYFGRGLMKDNLKPGFLARMLNKVF
jgi:flagellar L-ring protein FlgH